MNTDLHTRSPRRPLVDLGFDQIPCLGYSDLVLSVARVSGSSALW